jgi:hypothetical protein
MTHALHKLTAVLAASAFLIGLGAAQAGAQPATVKGTGRSKYEPITVKRGITTDPVFGQWANQNSSSSGKGTGTGKYGSIMVQRGVTANSAFGQWANQGSPPSGSHNTTQQSPPKKSPAH